MKFKGVTKVATGTSIGPVTLLGYDLSGGCHLIHSHNFPSFLSMWNCASVNANSWVLDMVLDEDLVKVAQRYRNGDKPQATGSNPEVQQGRQNGSSLVVIYFALCLDPVSRINKMLLVIMACPAEPVNPVLHIRVCLGGIMNKNRQFSISGILGHVVRKSFSPGLISWFSAIVNWKRYRIPFSKINASNATWLVISGR